MTQGRTTVVQIFGAMDRGGAEMRTLELIERVDREQVRSIFVTLSGCRRILSGSMRGRGCRDCPDQAVGQLPDGVCVVVEIPEGRRRPLACRDVLGCHLDPGARGGGPKAYRPLSAATARPLGRPPASARSTGSCAP